MVVEWTTVSNPSAMIFQTICQYLPDSPIESETPPHMDRHGQPDFFICLLSVPGFPREPFGSGTTQWSAHASHVTRWHFHSLHPPSPPRATIVCHVCFAANNQPAAPESLNSTASTCLVRNRVDLCTKIGLRVQPASKFVDNQKLMHNHLI